MERVVTDEAPRALADHRYFLLADLASNNLDRWRWHDRFRHPIVQFQRLMRHVEYLDGRSGPAIALLRLVQRWRLNQLGLKLGFTVPRHAFGPGLSLAHHGSIVVNGKARIGRNARIHSGVNIGELDGEAPLIGDDVYISPGAKLFGGITVGDRAVIGANAVVNRDVAADTVVAGIPARVIDSRRTGADLLIDGCAVATRRLGYTVIFRPRPPARLSRSGRRSPAGDSPPPDPQPSPASGGR
jgi:serine O-acetyltransferase